MTYINTGFAPGKAQFVDVNSNPVGANELSAQNANKKATVAGGNRVPMVSGHLTFVRPFAVEDSDVTPAPVLNETLKIQWNIRHGSDPATLRAELNRVLDIWIADMNLDKGVVPPVYATFTSE